MDGEALAVPDASFDAAFSIFGVILFADWRRGLREQARVLRSGGKACVATWGEPPGGGPFIAMSAALRSVFPDVRPSPPPAGMLALCDADRLSAEMSAAGLRSLQVHQVGMYISMIPRRCMVTCNPMRRSIRRIVSGSERRSGSSSQSDAPGRLSSFAPPFWSQLAIASDICDGGWLADGA
jgi:SAM-dependent methyltransferase